MNLNYFHIWNLNIVPWLDSWLNNEYGSVVWAFYTRVHNFIIDHVQKYLLRHVHIEYPLTCLLPMPLFSSRFLDHRCLTYNTFISKLICNQIDFLPCFLKLTLDFSLVLRRIGLIFVCLFLSLIIYLMRLSYGCCESLTMIPWFKKK